MYADRSWVPVGGSIRGHIHPLRVWRHPYARDYLLHTAVRMLLSIVLLCRVGERGVHVRLSGRTGSTHLEMGGR